MSRSHSNWPTPNRSQSRQTACPSKPRRAAADAALACKCRGPGSASLECLAGKRWRRRAKFCQSSCSKPPGHVNLGKQEALAATEGSKKRQSGEARSARCHRGVQMLRARLCQPPTLGNQAMERKSARSVRSLPPTRCGGPSRHCGASAGTTIPHARSHAVALYTQKRKLMLSFRRSVESERSSSSQATRKVHPVGKSRAHGKMRVGQALPAP